MLVLPEDFTVYFNATVYQQAGMQGAQENHGAKPTFPQPGLLASLLSCALIRVTIDAVPLLVRSAGVKNYLYYWTRQLRQESHGVDTARKFRIRLFPFLDEASWLNHEGSVANPITTRMRLGMLFLLNRFPNDISGWMDPDVDLFHTCKLLNPPRRAKLTATVHDLTCWLLPETHSPANVAADKLFAERILKRADALIAVSEATRSDAVRILNLPPEKIRVIHHGIADPFF